MKKFIEETGRDRRYEINFLGNVEGKRHYDVHYCEEGEEWVSPHTFRNRSGKIITVEGYCRKIAKHQRNPFEFFR